MCLFLTNDTAPVQPTALELLIDHRWYLFSFRHSVTAVSLTRLSKPLSTCAEDCFQVPLPEVNPSGDEVPNTGKTVHVHASRESH